MRSGPNLTLCPRYLLAFFLGMLLLESASGQSGNAPVLLHPRRTSNGLPVAIYQDTKLENFRKLVIGAFEDSRFSLTSIAKTKDGATQYKFSYPVPVGRNVQSIEVVVRVDENLDKSNRCARCFLRLAELPDLPALQKLPWMTQYEVSGHVFPAIDRAFAKIRADGQSVMDASFGFNYQDQWQGERNLYGNSFVGIDLPGLKAATIDSYRVAGFRFMGDDQKEPATGRSELVFSFPIDPDQPEGVVYKILLVDLLDERGNCYPCEISEAYDPYQQLPPAGLSGMSNRLSLESRFTAARTLAFERLEVSTERYLRPRSMFLVPPKPAPLGSPRPRPVPAVVT
jgi:hypothetical protein